VSFFASTDDATQDKAAVSASAPGEPATPPSRLAPLLRAGNIVIEHDLRGEGAALRALARDIAGPPSAALQRAGQAIEVRYSPSAGGVVAYAYQRRLRARDAADPTLREFAEYWLGRGAP
jgi:hypothetical protein